MADGYFISNGGLLQLVGNTTYPMSSAGLSPGAVWNDGGFVAIVPGTVPDPYAPGVTFTFPGLSPETLRLAGGGDIPTTPGATGSLWNCGGLVAVVFRAVIYDMAWASAPQSRLTVIPSYLYVQYNDDENLQAFVWAFNTLAQGYVDWFNQVNLPIYTQDSIYGALLDWVGSGLYGQTRPVFATGAIHGVGGLDTSPLNSIALNASRVVGQLSYYEATDDIYKRVITWNYYKGDGTVFSIPWLKRRIQRFILGANGTTPVVDFHPGVSITPTTALAVVAGFYYPTGALNTAALNTSPLDGMNSIYVPPRYVLVSNQLNITLYSALLGPMTNTLAAALQSGVLLLPFQFAFTVTVV